LPEAAAAIAAARRGQGDLVAGHVVGSSLFNLLVVIGGMAMLGDVVVPASFLRFELPAALAFALLLVPVLRGDLRVSRGDGGVLVVALLAWIAFELLMASA
jgi:cation:H+ antiporter